MPQPAHPEILVGSASAVRFGGVASQLAEPRLSVSSGRSHTVNKSGGRPGFKGCNGCLRQICSPLSPCPQASLNVLLRGGEVARLNKSGTAIPATWQEPKCPGGAQSGAGLRRQSPAPPVETRLRQMRRDSAEAEPANISGKGRSPVSLWMHMTVAHSQCTCHMHM